MRHRIAVIPGDNIGPEVVAEGLKVLRTAERLGHGAFDLTEYPWGAGHYLRTGEPMPADGVETLRGFDAIFFGAHGDPARVPDRVSSQGMFQKLRRGLQQYVNLRPARLLPGVVSPLRDQENPDLVVVRENSEGEYVGMGGRLREGTPEEIATQVSVVTRFGAERVMRFAFDLARRRGGKKRVTAATKSNALNYTMPLWDDVFAAVASAYPDVETDKYHIDAMAMHLVKRPETFDVIVTPNLFGDILSELAATVCGGVGLAPGANLNPERRFPSLFEPIHGSAPDIAGKGIANPVATILAAHWLLDWLGEREGARLVLRAVEEVLAKGKVRTPDLGGHASTVEVGDAICERMESLSQTAPA